MDNQFAIHVIHQDIQDQPLICIILNFFLQYSSYQTYQLTPDLTI